MNKRGVIEVQFNWIFIIIAGGVILTVFFGFINMQKDVQDTKIANVIMMHLDSIITGAKESSNVIHYIDIPQTDIKFSCKSDFCTDFGCTSSYSIDRSNTNHISIEPIFTSDVLRGKILITWSKPWYFPYEVISFLYMSTPEIRYVFVGTNEVEDIYDELPEKTSRVLVDDLVGLESENNYKIKFIFVDQDPITETLPVFTGAMHHLDVTAINIRPDPTSGFEGFGGIDFYKRDPDNNKFVLDGSSFYLGEASLMGAVFAEDHDFYECTMYKALLRLQIVSMIYKGRSQELLDYYADKGNSNCEQGFWYGLSDLTDLGDADVTDAATLYGHYLNLKDRNTEMRNYFTCEGLF